MAVSKKKKLRRILCLLHFNNWRQHSNFNFTSIISVQIKCTLILHKLSLSFFIFLFCFRCEIDLIKTELVDPLELTEMDTQEELETTQTSIKSQKTTSDR